MSRGGRIPINIPENTEGSHRKWSLFVKGKLGEMSYAFNKDAKVEVKDNSVIVSKEELQDNTAKCGERG